MNKKLILLIVILFGIFMPIVNAEELPKTGVTYFLEYPDGTERVTENYDEAANPEEQLIYSGVTNSEGQIVLSNYTQGTLRIKEVVPQGYSTNSREVLVNLSQNRNVEFTNTYGLINPQTSGNLFKIILVLGFAITVTILVKKNQKAPLLLIPIILCAVCNVKAESNDLVVTVKDSFGKVQSGIAIEIYAKPISIEASPAIKFDANGGNFFDGTTTMYFRLPNSSCTEEQLIDSLDENDANYLYDNYGNSYREGYTPNYQPIPATITNGTTVKVEWTENSETKIYTLYGNGGTFDFYGRTLTEIHTIEGANSPLYNYVQGTLNNNGYHFVGIDETSACNSYDQFGLNKEGLIITDSNTIYACWNQKPDGVYVNDIAVFVGSDANCFNLANSDPISLTDRINGQSITIGSINNSIYISKLQNKNVEENITKLEIVREGQTIITLTQNDLVLNGNTYSLADTTSSNNMKVWYDNYISMCGLQLAPGFDPPPAV